MSWTLDNLDLVAELTLSHIRLSVVPIVLSFVIAVPLGWVANRNPTLRAVTISAGSLLYTIPSLPLFVILPYILGTRVLSEVNVLVALTIYGVAVMVRSAADALASVDKDTRQAATAAVADTETASIINVRLEPRDASPAMQRLGAHLKSRLGRDDDA